MTKLQYSQQLFKLLLAINLVFISFVPAKAQKVNPPKNRQQNNTSQPTKKKPRNRRDQRTSRYSQPRLKFPYFRIPQRQGTPQGTRPAGSRNGCLVAEETPLTALAPITKETDGRQLSWGLTTKEYPTFWFYVPYELKSLKNVKFSLRNRRNQTIYETQLQLTDAPGVISVSLPPNAPSLKVGEWYQYYLFVDANCTSNRFSRKEVAQAWIKREAIASGFQTQLERISPRQRGLLYARMGIWYDAMSSFAELKDDKQMNSEWVQMLRSVGLEEVANVEVIDCCK